LRLSLYIKIGDGQKTVPAEYDLYAVEICFSKLSMFYA